ncbi:hypothetical protein [Brevibacillus borstelensis]|uniref:hypothetical protein n=1 Tax=Brevibacillus borstelensis TaxID=45462 RepID=UPI000A4133AC|nr:hypothetical protein [Brevibacillus borstelensis]
MTKEEIALGLAKTVIEKFSYKFEEYGGTPINEQVTEWSKLAADSYNLIYEKLK